MDAEGDFVVAWVDYFGQDGSGAGIYAQRYNATGLPQDGEFRVNTYTTSSQVIPSVGMDTDSNFVISWQSSGQDGSGTGIYARRYSAAGIPQGDEFRVNTYTTFSQSRPSIALDADGDFAISWDSGDFLGNTQDGSSYGIYTQRYGAPKISLRGQGQVITDNDISPSSSDGTDFDNAIANRGMVTHTFTISNTGIAQLTLGLAVISGPHANDFSVARQPSSPVLANGSTTFQITFSPSAIGLRTAEVSLTNNDDGENPYNFAIQGTGTAAQQSVYLPLITKS